jgi:hypothetical protein
MILAGRIATSPSILRGPCWVPGLQREPGWSRCGDGQASRQARNGLDQVAIVNQNKHASPNIKAFPQQSLHIKGRSGTVAEVTVGMVVG